MDKRPLSRAELIQVHPCYHEMIEDAWAHGEDVPYGMVYLGPPRELTEAEYQRGAEFVNAVPVRTIKRVKRPSN